MNDNTKSSIDSNIKNLEAKRELIKKDEGWTGVLEQTYLGSIDSHIGCLKRVGVNYTAQKKALLQQQKDLGAKS